MQCHYQTHEHPARGTRGGRVLGADHAAQGLARDAVPEKRRSNHPRRVALPLARLGAERVRGLPVAAAQHTRSVALHHEKYLTVTTHHARNARAE